MARRLSRLLIESVSVFSIGVALVLFALGGPSLAVSTGAQQYDAATTAYDGALHSVQAHANDTAPVASDDASEGVEGTAAIAIGHFSVLLSRFVAANSGPGAWASASESMSGRAAAYQAQVTGGAPGSVYRVNGVNFDGFANGVLQEAKGPGYANFVNGSGEFQPWFSGQSSLLAQAERQVAAAGGTPITWSVAEADAATAIQNLLSGTGINVVHVPAG